MAKLVGVALFVSLLLNTIGTYAEVENRVILQAFHWYIKDPGSRSEEEESNLWKFISRTGANRFKGDGFSDVWLPPMSKAFSEDNSYNIGYAVYDHYDLGEFDQMGRIRTKYGTKEELHQAIKALKKNGIKVIADVVMNHKLGTDNAEKIPFQLGFKVRHDQNQKRDIEASFIGSGITTAYLSFDFMNSNDRVPRGNRYSSFKWNRSHFDGMEFFDTYYLFSGKTPDKISIYNDFTAYPAEHTEEYKQIRSDIILGADLDFQNKEVREEMIKWTKWLIDETGVEGLRVDALRHIDIPFTVEWAREIKSYLKSKNESEEPLMFGEVWDGWNDRLHAYLNGKPSNNNLFFKMGDSDYCGIDNSLSLFDVPLHYDFLKIAKSDNSYPPTRMIDLPGRGLIAKSKYRSITFVDNHDTEPSQELASYIPAHTKIQAYTFILLNEFGIPTVYYRDFYKGNFVSEYESDQYEYLHNNIKSLINIRHRYAYGNGEYYSDKNLPGILGYKRSGDKTHTGSGLIYLIREFDSRDNGIEIPTDARRWELILGKGHIVGTKFYLDDRSNFAVWVPSSK